MDIEQRKELQHKKRAPNYTHFDYRVSLDQCWGYISDPENVSRHGFYPFIHYEIKSRKIKNGQKADPKVRNIFYAAHLDGWIYKYYAYKLNEFYNQRVKDDGLDSVAVAYRTELGKSNVHFAHEAFQFMKRLPSSYVMVGDFTDFFDPLDHAYLKERICELLHVESLPADYYAVFKNVTRFSFWELENLLTLNNLKDSSSERKVFNQKGRVLTSVQFHESKASIQPNPRGKIGVPQGSPISATLANIYMLSADKQLHDYVVSLGGFYMRYSDDFMIVLPDKGDSAFSAQYAKIKAVLDAIPKLNLQDTKTKLFHVQNNSIESCSHQYIPTLNNSKNAIDFLGFTYDGKAVTIREKTLSKYYHRLYRKAKTIVRDGGFTPDGKRISCKKLYEKYSYKGTIAYKERQAAKNGRDISHDKLCGNFLDYVERAQYVFEGDPINRGTKRHMQKIRKKLNEIRN
ncbi:MAG: reverse transcriptase domain-containing protein [Raoultibacter sp.]